MQELWADLSMLEKIYAVTAFVFSLFFIFQTILSFFGGDADHDADSGADTDADADSGVDGGIPFQFITFKNLVAFFTIGGWAGFVCLRSGMSPGLSIGLSFIAGIAMMVIMATIFYFMAKLADKGNVDENNAVGSNAEVYLIIPAQRKGKGKISVVVQGRLMEYEALTDDEEDISTGAQVKIIEKISAQTFLVSKI